MAAASEEQQQQQQAELLQFQTRVDKYNEEQKLTMHMLLYSNALDCRQAVTETCRPAKAAHRAARSALRDAMVACGVNVLAVAPGLACKLVHRLASGKDLTPDSVGAILACLNWAELVGSARCKWEAAAAAASAAAAPARPRVFRKPARPPLAVDVEPSECQLFAQGAYEALYQVHKPRKPAITVVKHGPKMAATDLLAVPDALQEAARVFLAAQQAVEAVTQDAAVVSATLSAKRAKQQLAYLEPTIWAYVQTQGGVVTRELKAAAAVDESDTGTRFVTVRAVTVRRGCRSLTLGDVSVAVDEAAAAANNNETQFLAKLRQLLETRMCERSTEVQTLRTRRHKLREEAAEEAAEGEKDVDDFEENEDDDDDAADKKPVTVSASSLVEPVHPSSPALLEW